MSSRAVPSYSTPEEAVGAFQHVARYHHSQALLLEAPAAAPEPGRPDIQVARAELPAADIARLTQFLQARTCA